MSPTNAFAPITKVFHWLTALLILIIIPLGVIANGAPFETSEELARKAWLFSLHKTLGVAVFFVALLRILWALTQEKPGPLHPRPPASRRSGGRLGNPCPLCRNPKRSQVSLRGCTGFSENSWSPQSCCTLLAL